MYIDIPPPPRSPILFYPYNSYLQCAAHRIKFFLLNYVSTGCPCTVQYTSDTHGPCVMKGCVGSWLNGVIQLQTREAAACSSFWCTTFCLFRPATCIKTILDLSNCYAPDVMNWLASDTLLHTRVSWSSTALDLDPSCHQIWGAWLYRFWWILI